MIRDPQILDALLVGYDHFLDVLFRDADLAEEDTCRLVGADGPGGRNLREHAEIRNDLALEDEIVPLYYERDRDGIPRGWLSIMRESIQSNAPRFSTRRMLKEYAELYIAAMTKSIAGQTA